MNRIETKIRETQHRINVFKKAECTLALDLTEDIDELLTELKELEQEREKNMTKEYKTLRFESREEMAKAIQSYGEIWDRLGNSLHYDLNEAFAGKTPYRIYGNPLHNCWNNYNEEFTTYDPNQLKKGDICWFWDSDKNDRICSLFIGVVHRKLSQSLYDMWEECEKVADDKIEPWMVDMQKKYLEQK